MFGQHCYICRWYGSLYGLDWYKSRRRTNRKLTKKTLVKEDYAATTKDEQQPIAEQLA
jgi:hypothetical protein